MLKSLFCAIVILNSFIIFGQLSNISGVVKDQMSTIPFASISLKGTAYKTKTNIDGNFYFSNIPFGRYTIQVSCINYELYEDSIEIGFENLELTIGLKEVQHNLSEFVISGTMKPVSKLESAVPVEVYSPAFFKTNPVSSVYEALSNVNGVKPQVNCAVCNTGDIHINGL